MSHFTRIRTQLVDREALTRALDDLSIPWDDAPARGWQRSTTPVDIRIPRGDGYDVGFVRGPQGYDMVGDFTMAGMSAPTFLASLKQRYAYWVTRSQLSDQGFEIVEEQTREDGRVHLLLRRLA